MRYHTLFAVLLISAALPVHAEQLDSGFGSNGFVLYNQPDQQHGAVAALPMPNGETVVVIDFPATPSLCPSAPCVALSRVSSTGVRLSERVVSRLQKVEAAAVDGSGRIIVVGPTGAPSTGDFGIMRFRPDLSNDPGFANNGYASVDFGGGVDVPYAVAIDALDNIVVGGSATVGTNDSDFGLARLQSNGQLDASFGAGGKATVAFDLGASDIFDGVSALSIGYDGKILLGGYAFDAGISLHRVALARLNKSGILDTGFCAAACSNPGYNSVNSGRTIYYFGANNQHRDFLTSVDVMANGGFLIAGATEPVPWGGIKGAIARFNPNGTYVTERMEPGLGGYNWFSDVKAIDATGTRILTSGESGSSTFPSALIVQAFGQSLSPIAGYGSCYTDASAICVQVSNTPGGHYSGSLNVDSLGRPLLNGNGVATPGAMPILAVSRLTNTTGPRRELIFRTGFN